MGDAQITFFFFLVLSFECERGEYCRREKLACIERGHAMQVLIQKEGIYRKLAPFSLWNDHPTTHYVRGHAKTNLTSLQKASPPTDLLSTTKVDRTLPFSQKTSLYHKIAKESMLCVFCLCDEFVGRDLERERDFVVPLSQYDIVLKIKTVF